jgi:hypothetical protein
MALLFMDSFDHYATADITEKGYGLFTNGTATLSIGAFGRRSSNGVRVAPGGAWVGNMAKSMSPSGAAFVVGFSFKCSALPSSACTVIQVRDAGTTQLSLQLNTGGTVTILRGTTSLATSTAVLAAGTTYYVEFKGVIDPSAGSVSMQVDASATGWPSFSGNTRATANTSWNSICFGANHTGLGTWTANVDFDDLYVLDQSGSAPWNTFLGDCRVDALLPSGAGATTGWTPSTGANYACVDETAPNDDTDYVSTSTTGATDTYTYPDAPVTGATIYGIQHCLALKKSDAGTCTVAPVVRHSGTDYVGSDLSPSTSYAYGLAVQQTNPGTSAQWTEAGFNAAEFGVKRTA